MSTLFRGKIAMILIKATLLKILNPNGSSCFYATDDFHVCLLKTLTMVLSYLKSFANDKLKFTKTMRFLAFSSFYTFSGHIFTFKNCGDL